MAYADLISLKRTLEQLVQQKPHWISAETRRMVDSLRDSFVYFQNFLEDTSKRRQHCEKFEELEREIRNAVNEAENVIELKIYEINEREALSNTFLRTLLETVDALKRELMSCRFGKYEVLTETTDKKALHETFSPLVEKIDAVKRNVMESSFGTNEVQGYGESTNEDLQMGNFLPGHSSRYVAKLNPENIVVGLEDDLMRVKRRLIGPPSNRDIIPILGMGGIGKTTLAKKVYDDPEIRHRFDIHVWVTVSQEYRIRDLLLGVLSCTSNEIKETDDQLMDMIYKKLKCRRYLVVMDDLWSCDVWDLMTRTFPDDNNGSRIILTSRLKDVAMHADPDSPPHEISLLNVDESWNLLHDKVFGIKQVCPPELEDIGKQVAQKCQGLPLALLVVAGHLSKIARTPESWKDVAKSVNNVVADEPDICLGVLAMSYNYLPNHLKPCFLYMGVFPEDSEVGVERLINLWVSEGFLLDERHKRIEEMGRECLEDLLSRNLLMVRKRRWNNEVRTCGVHDLIRDLILREAGKEKFLQVTRNHEATNPYAQKLRVRRYSFHSSIYQAACWESSFSDITRTLHFFGGLETPSKQVPHFERFKLLRVLVIFDFIFQDFPLEVTKLVHLRYLEFYCKDDIHWLVSELHNLQTLIFGHQGYKSPTIPASIWKMKHLRHLHVNGFFSFPQRIIDSFGFFSFLQNKLQNLEVLSCLALSSCTSELFSAIPNLKRLTVHHEEELTEFKRVEISQHLSNFSRLKELEILKFRGNRQYFRRMPGKYSLPASLNSLTLTDTCLPWEDMANIVMLPNLEVLKIKYHGFYGAFWRLNDNEIFNQLKLLLINETYLKHWDAGSVNFPKLQRLVLKRCFDLEEVPNDFGEICTLKSIELHKCKTSAAASATKIQEEQESMGNDCLSVLINDCRF